MNFFSWVAGSPTAKTCGKTGSVRFKRNYNGTSYTGVTAIFNVVFTDGTVWQDKSITLPYR